MKTQLLVILGAALVVGCAKGKGKSDSKDDTATETDAGGDPGTDTDNGLPSLNLSGAIGLALQGQGASLSLLSGGENSTLQRINADGSLAAAFSKDAPTAVNKMLSAPNGQIYVLFHNPPQSSGAGKGGAGDDKGGAGKSDMPPAGSGGVPAAGGSPNACLADPADGDGAGGDSDGDGGACLVGDTSTPQFAYLAVASKSDGKLTWLDTGLIGGLTWDGGAQVDKQRPGVQFDAQGGVYYIGKIERGSGVKNLLVRSTAQGNNTDLFDFASLGPYGEPRSYLVADAQTVYFSTIGDGLYRLNVEEKKATKVVSGGIQDFEMAPDGRLFVIAADEGSADTVLKSYDPANGSIQAISVDSVCANCGNITTLYRHGDRLLVNLSGLTQVYPTVEAYDSAASVSAILGDDRIVLKTNSDGSDKLVLRDDSKGTRTDLDIGVTSVFQVRSFGDKELIISGQTAAGKRAIVRHNFETGSSSVKETSSSADISDIQAL